MSTGPAAAATQDRWVRELGLSREAAELHAACDVVDLHVESFVWTRLLGYDLAARHGEGLLGARLYSQADLPRMLDGGLTGAVMSIATNPFRRPRRRPEVLRANLVRLRSILEAQGPRVAVVGDHGGYVRAVAEGRLACFLAVQGGNALARAHPDLDGLDPLLSRVTLVHLTRSALGSSSAPLGGRGGLTPGGRSCIEALNARRILVDLAHVSRAGFWDALAVQDPDQPPVVSHTGLSGAHDSWRNLDDDQVRAVADRGGVVGVMVDCGFLGESRRSGRADGVVRHVEHAVRVGGEDCVAVGSDWDGLIVPPRDLRTPAHLPVLTQRMLDRGFAPERVAKVLGGNYLRVLAQVRPGR